jgi:hypothetical protein
MSSADTVSTLAAQASAERIAQLKRLQRRVGGLRSATLPVSTTDDGLSSSFAPSSTPLFSRAMQSNESYAEPEYVTQASDRPRMSKSAAAPVQDVPDARGPGPSTDENIRMAAVIGSLLSYIRSTETSPDAFIDPSYFQSGYDSNIISR